MADPKLQSTIHTQSAPITAVPGSLIQHPAELEALPPASNTLEEGAVVAAGAEAFLEGRTFATFAEIQALTGFRADNGIDTVNYGGLLGDYHLPERIKCCYRDASGHLCRQDHNYGFVARLKDGSVTVVGNCCALDKFDDAHKLRSDRRKLLNVKRRRARRARLDELLAERSTRLAALEVVKQGLEQLEQRLGTLRDLLGVRITHRLYDMARSRNAAVEVSAVTVRRYNDESGDPSEERQTLRVRIGTLQGVGVFASERRTAIASMIATARRAFHKADHLGDRPKEVEIAALVSDIVAPDSVAKELDALLHEEQAFLTRDLPLLIYLTNDRAERYHAARFVLDHLGQESSRTRAKEWVIAQDSALRQSLKADDIRL